MNNGTSLTGRVTNTGTSPIDHVYLRVKTWKRMPDGTRVLWPNSAEVEIVSAAPEQPKDPLYPPNEIHRTLLQPGETGGVTLGNTLPVYPDDLRRLEVFTARPGGKEQPLPFTQTEDVAGFLREMDKANEATRRQIQGH